MNYDNPEGDPAKAFGYLFGVILTGVTFLLGLWKIAELIGIL